jgi:CubicO group peptidase (beta-lactamase class C family)
MHSTIRFSLKQSRPDAILTATMFKPLTILLALSATLHAQLPADTESKVAAIATKVLADTGVPSASVGIVQNGSIVYTHAFGLASLKPAKPADAAMAYPIGSISKQFTSTAALLLQQQGKLSIDDPVAKYFPELTRAGDITLRNLMTMTSGYEDFAPQDYSIPAWYQPRQPIDTIHEWATKPLDFEPGTQYQYSNTNYVLLALIIEKVTGKPFYQYLREAVLNPARLPDVFNAYTDREKLQVTGYQSYALQPPRVLPLEAASWYFGDGELAMPTASLLTWDLTLINQSLLSSASYKEMETPFMFKDGKPSTYGLGLHIPTLDSHNGHRELEHSGEVGGYVAENIVLPDDKLAIVVLTNEVASEAAGQIANQILALLLPEAMHAKPKPVPDTVAQQLPAILASFAKGQIDRSLFTANCNSYFTADTLSDYRATVAPLGPATKVERVQTNQRGGMTFGLYLVTFGGGATLTLDTYTLPDGKIEQLLILSKN